MFNLNNEEYATDKFLYKLIKMLKIGKENYWELNIYHENGKPMKCINEISINEKLLFATMSASFYKKHRLLEMLASSYVETCGPSFNKQKYKERLKSDQITNKTKLNIENHDLSNLVSSERQPRKESNTKQKIIIDKFKDTDIKEDLEKFTKSGSIDAGKYRTVGRNVELISKISTNSNAFSAIPCKEIKFSKRKISTGTKRKYIGSQELTSRHSRIADLNDDPSNRSKQKQSKHEGTESSEIKSIKHSSLVKQIHKPTMQNNENPEYSGYKNFAEYMNKLNLTQRIPKATNIGSIQERIDMIRNKDYESLDTINKESRYIKHLADFNEIDNDSIVTSDIKQKLPQLK